MKHNQQQQVHEAELPSNKQTNTNKQALPKPEQHEAEVPSNKQDDRTKQTLPTTTVT